MNTENKSTKKKKGFTLIELLVVVAIIGLLATLSVIALNNARARARDTRRVADVRQIQTALELYFNANHAYPATVDVVSGGTIVSGVTYMDPIPTAPTPADGDCGAADNTYTYAAVGDPITSYTLTYCLGAETGGIPAEKGTATPATIYDGT